ncbi:DUF5642 family protein [Nocardia transvalensis]|uniref:DUF5642 family protein n=1 Tax=Nocardia transvalensis TaxID=37333 RepID=UPI001893AA25|nr:DUF5642 family protein [Nocardia transvalensis]MBF6329671.1 DUF5642 family protein [Nocardia transvalensis]
MIVPDSPGSRVRRVFGRALGFVAMGCVAACGSTISGHPGPDRQTTVSRHVGTPLPRLLPGQGQFPRGYTTVVLSSDQARRAAGDIVGVQAGAQVDPADCAPPPQQFDADRTAVVVGTDDDTRATITVELTRTDQPLARLRDQLRRCGTVHARRGPVTNTVVTELDPPPPVNADDTLALHRKVTGQHGGPGLDRSLRTLLAQIGDVRINATYMGFGDGRPDTAGLDQVFTATVGDVRKG